MLYLEGTLLARLERKLEHVAEGKMSNPKIELEVDAGALSMVQGGLDKWILQHASLT
jgi:hypothetical protein